MTDKETRPFLLLTVVLDGAAKAAAITRSHGEAYRRMRRAAEGAELAGMDLVELPVLPASFAALRKHFRLPEDAIGLYELFPLAGHLDPALRRIAGQFLAAEVLWKLEDDQSLGGVPLRVTLQVPEGWERDPKRIHERLLQAGALDLTPEGIETFKRVKAAWDALSSHVHAETPPTEEAATTSSAG